MTVLVVLLLAALGALGYTAVQVTHRDDTIRNLQDGLLASRQRAGASNPEAMLPAASGSALYTFPGSRGGSFSVVMAAIRPRPGAGPLTWVFMYGRHATPGARYSLLDGTCGGQYVAPADAAQGIADRRGNVTIVLPNLFLSPQNRNAWVLVYRAKDGVTLGGIKGPFTGGGSVVFRTTPPC